MEWLRLLSLLSLPLIGLDSFVVGFVARGSNSKYTVKEHRMMGVECQGETAHDLCASVARLAFRNAFELSSSVSRSMASTFDLKTAFSVL